MVITEFYFFFEILVACEIDLLEQLTTEVPRDVISRAKRQHKSPYFRTCRPIQVR